MKFRDLGTMEALEEHVLAHGCYPAEENLRIFEKWFLERPPLTFLGAARKYDITSKRLCDVGCAYGGMLVYLCPWLLWNRDRALRSALREEHRS